MNKKLLNRSNFVRASLFTFFLAAVPMQAQQNALDFDGTSDYIQTNYAGVLGNGSRTVEAWVKTNSGNTEQVIATWGSDATSGARFTFRLNASGTNDVVRIENKGGGINGLINVNDGNWHHVAVVYDNDAASNKYKLYVDGVLDVEGDITTPLNTTAITNMIIGRRITASFGGYFDGHIDELRVWDVARTVAELSANMNTEFCGVQPNLQAYFKFNEGTPEADNTTVVSATDASGNGYVGTFNTFALNGTTSNFVTGATAVSATTIDDEVTLEDITLTATESAVGTTYQWVDCDNEDAPIDEATAQTFTPTASGNYAVIITKGGCSVQSACTTITIVAEVCEVPTAVIVEDITTSSALVSWTENGDATTWELLYGPTGFDVETEGETLTVETTAEVTLDELDANIGYDVYVRAVCGEDFTSEWTAVEDFTTLEEVVCVTPSAIVISDITETSALVSWTESGDATTWELLYGPTGFDVETEGETVTVDTTAEVTLDELDATTGYDVYVRTVCGEDLTSEWTAVEDFTTLEEVMVEPTDAIALNFDGSSDYIQTNYQGILGNNARTVEAWVKTNATVGEQLITSWGSDATNGGRFTIRLNGNSSGDYVVRIEVKGGYFLGTTIINDGVWHHVAVTYDNSLTTNKYKIFVDGVLDTEGNISQSLNTLAATNMIIGRRLNTSFGGYFNGSIDEVRVWSVARTQAEIAANKDAEFCGVQPNLQAYFKLNDGTPEADNTAVISAADTSGNGYVGTFNTFALNGLLSNYVAGALDVNETEVDNTVTLADVTITATQADAVYQWVDCNDNNAEIEGATNQSFTATESGNYAVRIIANGCTVLSECTEIVIEVCAVPTAVAVPEIGETTATVVWTENGTSTEWEVLYGPSGFDIATEGETLTVEDVATVVLDELDADTEYDVYVRAVCSETTTDWTAAETFTTEAAPVCATPSAIEVTEITSSSAMVSWTENGEAAMWEVLYGPVGFDVETEGESVTVDNDPEVILDELDADTEYDVYVRAVCGEDFTSNWESTDSFTTLEEAVCATPSTIVISEITSSSTMVSWTENGEATMWEVLYGPVGFDVETEGESVTVDNDPEVTLDELDADTEYDVYVRAVCGEDFTSNWESTDSFTTLEEAVCATPSAIEITDITSSSAMVSWTENGEATMWEVLYGPAGFDPETEGETVTVEDTSEVMLDELDAETEYHVYVRAICGEEMMSDWEGQEAFTTQTLGLNDHTIAGFAFYPNPTKGTLNISAQNNIESVVIYNLTGQRVMAVKVEASSSQLDVAKLSEGVYMMHVTSEGKTGVYKLVRK